MIKSTTKDSTPTLELPKANAQKDKMSGPKKSANLPKISKNPKYSLASFFGMSFPKWERDKAWIPPCHIPTANARIQNSVEVFKP